MRTTVVSSGLMTTQMPSSVRRFLRESRNVPAECEATAQGGNGAEEGTATECKPVAHGPPPYALPPSEAAAWMASRMR